MALKQFTVETYGVAHYRTSSGRRMIYLKLHGPLVEGIRKSATLVFANQYGEMSGHYLDPQVSVNLPYDEFAQLYNLLREEAPVHVIWEHGEGSTPAVYSLNLLTNNVDEPHGPPADINSVQELMRSWSGTHPPNS